MSVMIGTMAKNVAKWLPKYFELLEHLTYPKDKMEIGIVLGECSDNTLELLKSYNGSIKLKAYKEQPDEWLHRGGIYAAGCIWKDLQDIMKNSACDYFLFMDTDLVDYPTDLIERLIAVNEDVAAPYVWSEGHRHFFDNYVFRIGNKRFHPFNPPGLGNDKPVKVDSVGTCFLAKRDAWVKPAIGNPEPYFIWANNARKLGYNIVACPFIEIFHVDLEKLGIFHNPPPKEWSNHGIGWIDNEEYKVNM